MNLEEAERALQQAETALGWYHEMFPYPHGIGSRAHAYFIERAAAPKPCSDCDGKGWISSPGGICVTCSGTGTTSRSETAQ